MTTSIESTKHSSGRDPSATRWGRTGDPGSAFNGIGRAVKGRGNGRGRGGRRGVAKPSPDSRTSTVLPTPAVQKSNSISGTSQTTASPPPPVTGRIEKASTPSPTIPKSQLFSQSSSPSTLTSAGSARAQNRRRRPSATKNNIPQSKQISGAEPRLRTHRPPELPISKNTASPALSDTVNAPNPQNSSSDVKANIDALVERVRASAMANHRPGTPGSHIDWAGDDDDSLPDLDDWGIKSPAPITGNAMISPILVDGLTPLPESATLDQAQCQVDTIVGESTQVDYNQPPSDRDGQYVTEAVDDTDQSAVDGVLNEAKTSVDNLSNPSMRVSLHPSLPPKPASPMQQNGRQPNRACNAAKRRVKVPTNDAALTSNVTAARNATKNQVQAQNGEHNKEELGLSASIHAPSEQDVDGFTQSKSATYPTSEKLAHRSSVQHRASSRHAQSTNRVGVSYARSQSSPSLAKNNGRAPHRPVISGDAITKIAKTIGVSAPSSKSNPLSTSTE